MLLSLPTLVYRKRSDIRGASFRPNSDGVIDGTARTFLKIIVSVGYGDRSNIIYERSNRDAWPFRYTSERGVRRSGIEKRNTFFDRNSGEENVKMETWPSRTAQKRKLDLA